MLWRNIIPAACALINKLDSLENISALSNNLTLSLLTNRCPAGNNIKYICT